MKTARSIVLVTLALLFGCRSHPNSAGQTPVADHAGRPGAGGSRSESLSISSQPANWTILRGGGIGSAIMANTTEADLKRVYGSAYVTSENIDLGEGSSEPGTVLYPRDPLHRLGILWQEPQRLHPRTIMINGEKSVWKTVHDISLGTTLMQLERLNEKPFMLHGFAWDGSGGLTSWQKGSLEKELGDPDDSLAYKEDGVTWLALAPPRATNFDDTTYQQLVGETQFSSAHPGMQTLNPYVFKIDWDFPDIK
jgi:hypothetical protein